MTNRDFGASRGSDERLRAGRARDPHDPKGGGSCRGLQKHMYGGTSPSGGEKPLLVPLELADKPLTRIANRKLGWGSRSEHGRASLGNELSRPRLACPGPRSQTRG